MSTFNAACPICSGPVHITYFTVRECSVPIRESGWAVMATHKVTGGSESFECLKCQVSVPPLYVYKEMSLKEATEFMKKWGGNKFSIHNRMPITEEDKAKAEHDKEGEADAEAEAEPAPVEQETSP
jgi:hypothetical protein